MTPRVSSSELSPPTLPSAYQRHRMPSTSHGIAHGTISSARANDRPTNSWLSSTAVASPITVESTTNPAEKISVVRIELQNTGLESTTAKLSNPTISPRLAPFDGTLWTL